MTDSVVQGERIEARAWGVEHLAPIDRLEKVLRAGADQLGGEHCTELLIELVNSARVSEDRIDASVTRLLREKFILGLFDNPYVDVDEAEIVIGNEEFRSAGQAAQRVDHGVEERRADGCEKRDQSRAAARTGPAGVRGGRRYDCPCSAWGGGDEPGGG